MGSALRVYTYDEAKKLVERLQNTVAQMQEAVRGLAEVEARLKNAPAGSPEHRGLETEARFLQKALEADQLALAQWGVILRDLEEGVVDIPFRRNGELVYLTWKLGEAAPAYWHAVTEDYHARRPLTPALERDSSSIRS